MTKIKVLDGEVIKRISAGEVNNIIILIHKFSYC